MTEPKHPIDMVCTACNALEETSCTFARLDVAPCLSVGNDGSVYHLARIHAATAANQIADLTEDNRRLCELAELQSRTLGRALKRWGSSAFRDVAVDQVRRQPPKIDTLPNIAAHLRVSGVPLEDGTVTTLAINGAVNDRPLYACTQSGRFLRSDDVIDPADHGRKEIHGQAACPNHDGAACVLIGYEA